MRVLLRILGLVYRKYPYRILAGYIAVLGSAGTALVIPRVLGSSVNQVLESREGDVSQLYTLAGVLLLAGLGRGLFRLAENYIAEGLSQRLAYDLRNAYYAKLQHLSFAFHDRQSTGSLMSRATADVEGLRNFANMGGIRAAFVLIMFIGIGTVMLVTDVTLGLIGLAFVPILGFRSISTSVTLRRIWLHVQELTGQMVAVLQENLIGNRVVRAFAAEEYEKRKFRASHRKVTDARFRAERKWAGNFATLNFGFILATGVMLWVGGQQVLDGRSVVNGEVQYTGLTPGDLTSFLFYMGLLTMPVRMLGWMVNNASRASSCGQRIFEILDADSPVRDMPGARNTGRLQGRVVFDHVSFSYNGTIPTLKDVSVEVEPGQMVALLGRPGSGKTTFAHLLPRFYDVSSGNLSIDGIDVREFTLDSLRDNVGIVQQDVFIHSATVRENISYGQVGAPLEKVTDAARIAQLHDFIGSLPRQFDSPIGERGVSLSGGQKQRLSIARTILRDPPILILDDSTSSIDAYTEHRLQEAMETVLQGRTTFIITHRLSAIRKADLILVFQSGRIVERGVHDELMARNGLYRDLYESQLRPQEETALHEAKLAAQRGADL